MIEDTASISGASGHDDTQSDQDSVGGYKSFSEDNSREIEMKDLNISKLVGTENDSKLENSEIEEIDGSKILPEDSLNDDENTEDSVESKEDLNDEDEEKLSFAGMSCAYKEYLLITTRNQIKPIHVTGLSLYPYKHQKTSGSLMFSCGRERDRGMKWVKQFKDTFEFFSKLTTNT